MTFHVGQKVVCVNNSRVECEGLRLTEYTVTATTAIRGQQFIGVDGMSVMGDMAPWFASRFRPIVERKTDISALKALLVPGAKIREPA